MVKRSLRQAGSASAGEFARSASRRICDKTGRGELESFISSSRYVPEPGSSVFCLRSYKRSNSLKLKSLGPRSRNALEMV